MSQGKLFKFFSFVTLEIDRVGDSTIKNQGFFGAMDHT